METAPVEIARFRDGGPLKHCLAVLDKAGIAYRVSHDAPVFDMMSIGRGSDPTAFVVVAAENEVLARNALLEHARANTKAGMLKAHYFQSSPDDDLLDVVRYPAEWSPEDVAAAECLLTERQVTFTPACYVPSPLNEEETSSIVDGHILPGEPTLPGEKSAGWPKLVGAYLFGGVISFIIGWNLFHGTEKTRDGRRRFVYNPASRTQGAWLMLYSALLPAVLVILQIIYSRR